MEQEPFWGRGLNPRPSSGESLRAQITNFNSSSAAKMYEEPRGGAIFSGVTYVSLQDYTRFDDCFTHCGVISFITAL